MISFVENEIEFSSNLLKFEPGKWKTEVHSRMCPHCLKAFKSKTDKFFENFKKSKEIGPSSKKVYDPEKLDISYQTYCPQESELDVVIGDQSNIHFNPEHTQLNDNSANNSIQPVEPTTSEIIYPQQSYYYTNNTNYGYQNFQYPQFSTQSNCNKIPDVTSFNHNIESIQASPFFKPSSSNINQQLFDSNNTFQMNEIPHHYPYYPPLSNYEYSNLQNASNYTIQESYKNNKIPNTQQSGIPFLAPSENVTAKTNFEENNTRYDTEQTYLHTFTWDNL